ncbi:MAG TPA: type IX secretion system membrane protein PorP/SprF [Ohtaekwangia sp.]|uniref:PorP/SprF family type IX secretion system membrane protein n=1 Tax=Ohtaekwangia sp. TaxID=2066019 RepID=UPI002F94B886
MKKLLVYIVLAGVMLVPWQLRAQHNIVYSQYIFNGLLINPAYAGSHVQLSSSLSYRNQWINFDGAPVTSTFGIHSSFKKEKVGLGLLVTNDKIGSYRNTGLYGSYAFIIKAPRGGVLSLGVQGGFNNFKADFSQLNMKVDGDPIFNGFFNELRPNFGGGVFYYNKKMFAGFSVPTILKHADFFKGSFEQLALPRVYYLHAGTYFPVDRMEKVKISPSFLLRVQDGTPLSADINVNVIFQDLISIGNSYRTGDAIITFISFKLSEKFQFVYSYDWTTSSIGGYSKGTHEFMINYRTRIRRVHKDVECPYFFTH